MGTSANTAALYLRKSSMDDRAGDNRSITDQRHDLERLAERHGLQIVAEYEEKVGTSASHIKNHDRPQYDRALAEMGSTYEVLLSWRTDRLVRAGMLDMGKLLDVVDASKGRVITDDGTDTNQPGMRSLLAMLSEQSRAYVVSSTDAVRRGKEGQRRRGEYQGGSLPYGLLRDKDAEFGVSVDQEAAEVLRRAVDMLIAGSSLKEACAAINADGHRTSTGSAWTATTLSRVVRSPHMVGHRYYKTHDIYAVDDDGNRLVVHEPIITEATFRRVDKAMSARRRRTNNLTRNQPTAKRHASLLGGITRCADCQTGFGYDGVTKTLSTGEVRDYCYYRCRGCERNFIRYDDLNQHVARNALLFLASLDPESSIVEEVGRRWLARFTPDQVNRHGELRDEIDTLEGRHRELQVAYFDRGTMDTDVFERLDRKMAGDIADLRDELRDTPTPQADLSALFDLAQSSDTDDIVGPGSAWANLPDYERREIIRCLVDQVTITRSEDRHDIVGRTTIEFATESNVIDLANRSERILGKHVNRKVKVAS
jgi:DNA invertase Pin-like site-specific DNA recombinase